MHHSPPNKLLSQRQSCRAKAIFPEMGSWPGGGLILHPWHILSLCSSKGCEVCQQALDSLIAPLIKHRLLEAHSWTFFSFKFEGATMLHV
jgi:hypothetical protein